MFISLMKIISLIFISAFVSKAVFIGWYEFDFTSTSIVDFIYSLAWGIRFDLTVSFMLTALGFLFITPFYRFKNFYQYLYAFGLSFSVLGVVFSTMADAIYMSQASRHITMDISLGKGMELELASTAIIQYPWLFLGATLISLFFITIIVKRKFKLEFYSKWYKNLLCGILFVASSVFVIRGGFNDHPQSPMSVYKIGDADLARVAWSAPYAMTYYGFISKENIAYRWTPVQTETQMLELQKKVKTSFESDVSELQELDIIMVLLESWAAVDMAGYGAEVDATPYFDSLRKSSLTTSSFYSNGFRTVEGIFATMCSMPNPIGSSVAGTDLMARQYQCLPQMLKDKGWETTIIQGSGQGIVGSFSQSLGFENSYGKFDFPDSSFATNYWGYMDDGIYDFALRQLDSKSTHPKFMVINTGTTHDSFLPSESDYVFGSATPDERRRSTVHHADQALERFVTEIESKVSKPTLIILVADHTAIGAKNDLRHVSIPFLMRGVNIDVPVLNKPVAASHRDIAPTILDIMGGKASWFSGHSLLSEDYKEGANFSVNNEFFWIANHLLMRINAQNGNLESCAQISENTTDLEPVHCDLADKSVQEQYENGINYMLYSQQHLFEGTTMAY